MTERASPLGVPETPAWDEQRERCDALGARLLFVEQRASRLTPASIAAAGRVADGVILPEGCPPAFVATVRERVDAGARGPAPARRGLRVAQRRRERRRRPGRAAPVSSPSGSPGQTPGACSSPWPSSSPASRRRRAPGSCLRRGSTGWAWWATPTASPPAWRPTARPAPMRSCSLRPSRRTLGPGWRPQRTISCGGWPDAGLSDLTAPARRSLRTARQAPRGRVGTGRSPAAAARRPRRLAPARRP
jgi:hypothetical protein